MRGKCRFRFIRFMLIALVCLSLSCTKAQEKGAQLSDTDVDIDDSCQANPPDAHVTRGKHVKWHHKGQKDIDIDFDPNKNPFDRSPHYHASHGNPDAKSDPVKQDAEYGSYKYSLKTADCHNDPTIIVDR